MSSVNTFRILLNEFFDTKIPLLDNKIFYSNYDPPYEFEDFTSKVNDLELIP